MKNSISPSKFLLVPLMFVLIAVLWPNTASAQLRTIINLLSAQRAAKAVLSANPQMQANNVFVQTSSPPAAPAQNATSTPSHAAASPVAPTVSPSRAGDVLVTGWWGPGGYFSAIKLSLFILFFFIWVYYASWMNCDMERLKNPNRQTLNLVYLLVFFLGGLGSLFIPIFWAAFPVYVLLWLVPVLVYTLKRNALVPPHEKVMTGEHLHFLFAKLMLKFGVKIKIKQRQKYETGPAIEFETIGKDVDPQTLQGRLILARNSDGYNDLRQHVYDALLSRADAIMFDFTPERTVIRHQVDGVWLELPPIPRVIEKGKTMDSMEEVLVAAKILVGVNPNDRRSRQVGTFIAKRTKKIKYEVGFTSQGTQTGEAVVLQFNAAKVPFQTLEDLGCRPEQKDKLLSLLNAPQGLLVVSAMPGNGLRSSMNVFIRNADRFTTRCGQCGRFGAAHRAD